MKGRVIVLCLVFTLLTLPLVVAEPSFNFRESTTTDIKIACVDVNKSLCSSTTPCQITINYPNNTNLVQNGSMTYSDQFYNFTLDSTQTVVFGEYSAWVACQGDQGLDGFSTFTYLITATGDELSTSQGILYIIALVLGLSLFGLALYGAIKIPWANVRDEDGVILGMNDLKYVKLFLWYATYMIMVWLTFLAYNITYGYLQFGVASNFFEVLFRVLMVGIYPISVVFLLTALIKYLRDFQLDKKLRRGLTING